MQDGEDAFLARLDCQTGAVEWKTNISQPVRSFSTPFLFERNGRRTAAISGANRTFGYDPQNGDILWTADGPAEKTVSSLVCDDDCVFVAGGRDNMLLAIQPDGSGDVTESHVACRATRGIPYINSPLLYEDHLHVLADDGIYSCFDPSTGKQLVQKRLGGKWSSSPVGVAGRVYLTNESGRTIVIDSGAEFSVLAENDIGEPVFASLAITSGEFFIRSDDHLFRVANDPQ